MCARRRYWVASLSLLSLNQAPPPPARTLSASAPERAAGQLPPQECSGSGSAVGVQVRARVCVRACVRVRARVYVCVLVCLCLQECDAPAVPEALHMTRMQASGALSTSPDRSNSNQPRLHDRSCLCARAPSPSARFALPGRAFTLAAPGCMLRALQKIAETLYHEGSLSSVEAVSKEVRCARPK